MMLEEYTSKTVKLDEKEVKDLLLSYVKDKCNKLGSSHPLYGEVESWEFSNIGKVTIHFRGNVDKVGV